MLENIVSEKKIELLNSLISRSNHILITCHVSPDGDAVGSSLGLKHLLSAMGKDVYVATPDMIPSSLMFLPGTREVKVFTRQEALIKNLVAKADLIFCLDYNSLSRIDRMSDVIGNSTAKKVVIDHHLGPDIPCDIEISYPVMSSTCELLFRVVYRLGMYAVLPKKSAECIYTGMMTDTGNFSYNSNRSDIYLIIAKLLNKGIDKDKLYNLAMNTNTADCLRLTGYALSSKMEVFPDSSFALISLTKAELKEYNYQRGDTEGLVNKPLSIPGITRSIFIREDEDYVKVSARSVGDNAVNTICSQYFNGGGHKNAAGGEFYGTIDEAHDLVKKIIEELKINNDK